MRINGREAIDKIPKSKAHQQGWNVNVKAFKANDKG